MSATSRLGKMACWVKRLCMKRFCFLLSFQHQNGYFYFLSLSLSSLCAAGGGITPKKHDLLLSVLFQIPESESTTNKILTFALMRGIYLRLKKVYIYTLKNTVFFSISMRRIFLLSFGYSPSTVTLKLRRTLFSTLPGRLYFTCCQLFSEFLMFPLPAAPSAALAAPGRHSLPRLGSPAAAAVVAAHRSPSPLVIGGAAGSAPGSSSSLGWWQLAR